MRQAQATRSLRDYAPVTLASPPAAARSARRPGRSPPGPRSQHPLPVPEDVGAVVDDPHGRVEEDAVEVERADVLPAGIGVVVVAQGKVDGTDPALLGRCAEGRL